jgi:hypothetical protein
VYNENDIPSGVFDAIEQDALEKLAERADRIRERHLNVPRALPERVASLARSIVEDSGAQTDFDKASALESYLFSSYTYTLDTDYTPPGEDFVDHFLFSMRSGYCTHFASALAVMARCVGLPSRYVEGYTMPGERGEDGAFRVTNAEAHAWVEIYFEGYGWKRFEPTSSYQGWGAALGGADGSLSGEHVVGAGRSQSYYDMMMRRFGQNDDEYNMRGQGGGAVSFIDTGGAAGGGGMGAALLARVIAAVAAAVLAVAAITAFALRRAKRARRLALFAGGEPREAVAGMLFHYCAMLRWIERGIEQTETLPQYAARVDESLSIEGGGGLSSVTGVFERLCYSDGGLTEDDRSQVSALYPRLVGLVEQNMNKLAFRFRRDILSDV